MVCVSWTGTGMGISRRLFLCIVISQGNGLSGTGHPAGKGSNPDYSVKETKPTSVK